MNSVDTDAIVAETLRQLYDPRNVRTRRRKAFDRMAFMLFFGIVVSSVPTLAQHGPSVRYFFVMLVMMTAVTVWRSLH